MQQPPSPSPLLSPRQQQQQQQARSPAALRPGGAVDLSSALRR
eukprot:SAG25_NODE_7532_length_474_cov_1.101333_1_plen_42_part_10